MTETLADAVVDPSKGAPPAGLSPFAAIAGVFFSPGKTFEALAVRPTWWLPFLVIVATTFGSFLLVAPKIDVEGSIRQMMARQAERTGSEVPPARVDAVVEKALQKSPVVGAAQAAAFVAVAFFFMALLYWGGARAMGGEARYAHGLCVWGHGSLPWTLKGLVALPLMLSLPDAALTQVQAGRYLKSNLGAFLPDSMPAFVRSVGDSLDIFSFVALAFLVIGMRRLPAINKPGAAVVPLVVWGIYVIGKSALTAAFLG